MSSPSEVQRQILFGAKAIDAVQAAAKLIPPGPRDNAHIYAIALHVTITELFGGCLVLADTGQSAGIPILLRSMYEALVDLDNLVHDASYVEHLEAANLEQAIKLLDQAGSNPLFKGLSETVDVDANRAAYASRIPTSGPQGCREREARLLVQMHSCGAGVRVSNPLRDLLPRRAQQPRGTCRSPDS